MAFELLRFVRVHCAEKRLRFILHLPYAHAVYALRVLFAVDFKEHNTSTNIVTAKILILIVLVYVIWEVPGVFTILFKPFEWLLSYTDPKKPDANPMHEWFFRSGLDNTSGFMAWCVHFTSKV